MTGELVRYPSSVSLCTEGVFREPSDLRATEQKRNTG
jgi:hypothetical protein